MKFPVTFCFSLQHFYKILRLMIKGSKGAKHTAVVYEKGVPVLIRHVNAFFILNAILLFFFIGITKFFPFRLNNNFLTNSPLLISTNFLKPSPVDRAISGVQFSKQSMGVLSLFFWF